MVKHNSLLWFSELLVLIVFLSLSLNEFNFLILARSNDKHYNYRHYYNSCNMFRRDNKMISFIVKSQRSSCRNVVSYDKIAFLIQQQQHSTKSDSVVGSIQHPFVFARINDNLSQRRYDKLSQIRFMSSSSSNHPNIGTSSEKSIHHETSSSLLSTTIPEDSDINAIRKELLHKSLFELNIDVNAISTAATESIQNPIGGYDGRFGKSAIRAYRSFVNSSLDQNSSENLDSKLNAMADRTARQIQFLMNRHKSHQMEWIRHHDTTTIDPVVENQKSTEDQQQSQPSPKLKTKFPIIIVLDNVRSALNVGNIFRTADASGCQEIITVGITPHPGGNGADKVQKSALGAEFTVPHRHVTTTQQAIHYIQQKQHQQQQHSQDNQPLSPHDENMKIGNVTTKPYVILGMETTEKSIPYIQFNFADRLCSGQGIVLILGNEVTGIDVDILSSPELDAIIEIPMYGTKNSLNIAVCAPIVIYEIIRQLEIVKTIQLDQR
jgi:23S rRNA (guanosine2251-2'-O)-methyltransferase